MVNEYHAPAAAVWNGRVPRGRHVRTTIHVTVVPSDVIKVVKVWFERQETL